MSDVDIVSHPEEELLFSLSFTYHTNAQVSSSLLRQPQFLAAFTDVSPSDLNADVTSVTVPIEAPAS